MFNWYLVAKLTSELHSGLGIGDCHFHEPFCHVWREYRSAATCNRRRGLHLDLAILVDEEEGIMGVRGEFHV